MIGASSVPMLTSISAGSVMHQTGHGRRQITACTGTWFLLRLAQYCEPGTAPSRLNANSMREARVMQAMEQKNCPIAAISSTFRRLGLERLAKMTARRRRPP